MIDQLTVFLENSEGRLAKLCRAIADAGINMDALTIADTVDYGVVRIVCSDPVAAKSALEARGYRAMVTKVAAIELPNRPGALAELLSVLDDLDIPVEYGYCFSASPDRAVDVLKVGATEESTRALLAIGDRGFKVLSQSEL